MLSPPATAADGSGLEAPRTDPMWHPHSGHPPTTPSAYSSADDTYYNPGSPLSSYRDCLTTWRLTSSSAGHHVDWATPPVASGSGSPPSLSSISQDVYEPILNATASSVRYSYYSLPASTPAAPAYSPMPSIDPLLVVPMGHHVWTPPATSSMPDNVNWPAIQGVDPSYPNHAPGQALPTRAATFSVNFWDGDPYGGAAQATDFSLTDAQSERLATAEELAALRDGLHRGDGNSGDGRVLMASAPDMSGRCSPASQAVIELLAGSLGHGGGAPFYPTPSPSAISPVEGMHDAICGGSSQVADTPPREHWADAPWRPSALLARLEEGLPQPAQPGASGGGSVTPIAPFMAMLS
ncbi:hypothetical protein TRAPUB_7906 [Trametes pubescens]|uniref:Uncharacterized protein n=1 Tax=Trametes pubescens TaxID=154538 RepID=A0A1M2V245_TRAPU|nr:hypothetical protein TRAPUB_7906 [Trametes pubescens]